MKASLLFSLPCTLGCMLLLSESVSAIHAQDLIGYWDLLSPNINNHGTFREIFFHIEQSGETPSGELIRYPRGIPITGTFAGGAITLEAIYQQMGEALEATGRPMVYSLCEYGRAQVWTGWGAKAGGNLWRTTGDISDRWESMDRIGFSQIKLAPFARPGHWNNPDTLEIGNGGMTADEYRKHMSLWSLLAAPLIAGNDLRSMSEETKSILLNREVIAIDQDPGYEPVTTVSSSHGLEVLMRPLHDGSMAVGLINRTLDPAEISFPRASLPDSFADRKVKVRDLWKHDTAVTEGDSFAAGVPAHGVVPVRFQTQ